MMTNNESYYPVNQWSKGSGSKAACPAV
eukprot:SAG11_NODE_9117_length_941_cov_0.954869_1_plen_27_part_10